LAKVQPTGGPSEGVPLPAPLPVGQFAQIPDNLELMVLRCDAEESARSREPSNGRGYPAKGLLPSGLVRDALTNDKPFHLLLDMLENKDTRRLESGTTKRACNNTVWQG